MPEPIKIWQVPLAEFRPPTRIDDNIEFANETYEVLLSHAKHPELIPADGGEMAVGILIGARSA